MPRLKLPNGFLTVSCLAEFKPDGTERLGEQIAVLFVVIGNQHPVLRVPGLDPHYTAGVSGLLRQAGNVPSAQADLDMEDAALTFLAADRDVPSHQTRKSTTNGQAKPRSRSDLLPALGLFKALEQPGDVLFGNALACILHFGHKTQPSGLPGACAEPQCNAACLRELHGIAQQVTEHLPHLSFVGHDVAGQLADALHNQVQFLRVGVDAEHRLQVIDERMQIEGRRVQYDAPSLDLRDFEDVIDDRQQVLAAAIDDIQLLQLLGGRCRIALHQLGEPQNRSHRRTDFMRHVRQKDALGAVGGFGVSCSFCQFSLQSHLLSDVLDGQEDDPLFSRHSLNLPGIQKHDAPANVSKIVVDLIFIKGCLLGKDGFQ